MSKYTSFKSMGSQVVLAIGTALCVLMAIPLHAASSFPNDPLMTGGEGIPPNILLILDDSGSMGFVKMPVDVGDGGLRDRPADRSYINNTIYYNPATTYRPWRTSSTDLNARLPNADYRAVSRHVTSPETMIGAADYSRDLRGHEDAVFYIPKTGVANPGTNASNYVRYFISAGGKVMRDKATVLDSWTQTIPEAGWVYKAVNVPGGSQQLVVTISGNNNNRGNADLYVRYGGNPSQLIYDGADTGSGSSESVTISSPQAGTWYIGIWNVDSGNGNRDVTGNVLTATSYGYEEGTPTGRSQDDELQNFANWYQYARTRSKVAKAGASEAFGLLGSRYRVGFDTIWNRGGSGGNTNGSSPNYPIPYATDDGRFSGSNRDTFYERLHGATASSGTPLHGALQRAARYYSTDNPWKDSSGSMLSCRLNYSLLTTDGYWNSKSGYSDLGNTDTGSTYGDAFTDTLADVAYQYWKNDMRTDMTDNVRTSPANPANWQHMVTFGISIGLQGTLDTNSPPPNPWNADPTDREDAERIDDLWHAALNGHGQFIVANDVDTFSKALKSAFATIDARTSSGSNIASTSTKTDSSTLTFVAGFTSNTWLGDLVASPFNASLTGVSDTPIWRLSKTFEAGKANENFSSRRVFITWNGAAQAFNRSLPNSTVFTRSTGTDAVSAQDNIDYIRGVQTLETNQTNGVLRQRAYPFGDIVDSSPAYSSDSNTVYVGANDGMLHGIDAANGQVLFSYLPAGLDYTALASISSTGYSHRYFVDGAMDVTKKRTGFNRNVLVAALGRGGKGVFALDVTSPASFGAGDVKWDYTFKSGATGGVADDDMGFVLGAIRIREANNGRTYAFVPNGIDSVSGKAVLFLYEIASNGSLSSVTELHTPTSGGNGLMGLGMADLNQDGKIDAVYGGDLHGNVWKWDFSSTTALPTTATRLFQATDSLGNIQPITGGLGLARDNSGKVFVGFGTGRYISTSDVPGNAGYVAQTQSMYGIIDTDTLVNRTDLQQRTIPYLGKDAKGRTARGFENYAPLPDGKKGWYINLGVPADTATGERIVTSPTVFNAAMYVSSIIPATGSDCSGALGSGYINVVNVFTGTSPQDASYFDDTTRLPGSGNSTGAVGSINLGGGMPTQVNVTSSLVTAGDGTGTGHDGDGGNSGTGGSNLNPSGGGGQPLRVNWRELIPTN